MNKLVVDTSKEVEFPITSRSVKISSEMWNFIFSNDVRKLYNTEEALQFVIGFVPIDYTIPSNVGSNQGGYNITIFHTITDSEIDRLSYLGIELEYDDTLWQPIGMWIKSTITSPESTEALKSYYTSTNESTFPLYGSKVINSRKTYTYTVIKGEGLVINGPKANKVVEIDYDGLGGNLDIRNSPVKESSLISIINKSFEVSGKNMYLSKTTYDNCSTDTINAAKSKGFTLYYNNNGTLIRID